MLHVTRQTVSNYETGRSRPDVEMLTELAQALDVDIKELVYGPIGREHSARLLRRLAVGAVLTGLAAILYFVGGARAQRLLLERYLAYPVYMVTFFGKPLFFILLSWTLSQGCLILLRSEPLHSRWAVRSRRLLLAGIAVWLAAVSPWFFYLARACGRIFNISRDTALSPSSPVSPPMRFCSMWAVTPGCSLGAAPCAAQPWESWASQPAGHPNRQMRPPQKNRFPGVMLRRLICPAASRGERPGAFSFPLYL